VFGARGQALPRKGPSMPTHDTTRMPALFLAHGNPMNALADNDFTRALTRLADDLPSRGNPRRVCTLADSRYARTVGPPRRARSTTSAASRVSSTRSNTCAGRTRACAPRKRAAGRRAPLSRCARRLVGPRPRLLGGAPSYVARGRRARLRALARHDRTAPEALAPRRALAPLRDEGVLVVGSGNIVHSFAGVDWREDARPHAWAEEFDAWIADALLRGDEGALVGYESAGTMAHLSVRPPTTTCPCSTPPRCATTAMR